MLITNFIGLTHAVSEYPDCIVINNQAYDKETLKTIPFHFMPGEYFRAKKVIFQDRNWRIAGNSSGCYFSAGLFDFYSEYSDGYIPDTYNKNVFYYTDQSTATSLYQATINPDTQIVTTKSISADHYASFYRGFLYYVEQDKDFIWFLDFGKSYGVQNNVIKDTDGVDLYNVTCYDGIRLKKINKKTFSTAANILIRKYYSNSYKYNVESVCYKLYSDKQFMYLLEISNSDGGGLDTVTSYNLKTYASVLRVNKNTHTVEQIGNFPYYFSNSYQYAPQCMCNPITDPIDNTKSYFIRRMADQSNYVISTITIDPEFHTYTLTDKNMPSGHHIPIKDLNRNGSYYLQSPRFSLFRVNQTHIALIITTTHGENNAAGASFFGMHVFDNDWNELSYIKFNEKPCGCAQLHKNLYLVSFCEIIKIFKIHKDYTVSCVYYQNGSFTKVCVDDASRIWVLNNGIYEYYDYKELGIEED